MALNVTLAGGKFTAVDNKMVSTYDGLNLRKCFCCMIHYTKFQINQNKLNLFNARIKHALCISGRNKHLNKQEFY